MEAHPPLKNNFETVLILYSLTGITDPKLFQ